MRAVVQRVKHSSVKCEDTFNEIGIGLNVLLGVEENDTMTDADYIINKILSLRIFNDNEGKLNLSVKDIKGEILLISQFTLLGDARKGNRPSFIKAAGFEEGKSLYEYCLNALSKSGINTKGGVYGGDMCVEIINDGPVTILLDSKKLF